MWIIVILFLVAAFTCAYFYITRRFGWFKSRGIEEYDPKFPFGSSNTWELFTGKRGFTRMLDTIYERHKDKGLVGYFFFWTPFLVLTDLELAKQIFIKDFDHFTDRRKIEVGHEYLDKMMFMLAGEEWREMRSLVSPVFTSGKLKAMSGTIDKVGAELVDYVEKLAADCEDVNARDLAGRFTTQSIATAGFGIDSSAFDDEKSEKIRQMARQFSGADITFSRMLKGLTVLVMPRVAKALGIESFDRESLEFFADIVKQTVKSRKGEENKKRNDMVDLLAEALRGDVAEEGDAEIETMLISNLMLLLFAGMDTTSTILAVCMHCLATNPRVQDRLYEEISEVLSDGELNYNGVQALPYLDMVVYETLRFWPLGDLERKCVKDYRIPGTDVVIPEGMVVQLPSTSIMRDEEHFPNPDDFDPENFSRVSKEGRNPYAFLTFGLGPRNCIGSRLALLQLKVAVAHLVRNFVIVTCAKTPAKPEVDQRSVNADAKGGFWVRFEKRAYK